MPSTTWTRCHDYRGNEVEYEVEVDFDYEPGEKPIRYGDSACPGSDAEVVVNSVEFDGRDITDELGSREMERLEEYLRERFEDNERDRLEAMREDEADRKRDR